jgi:protein-S-isoprenylcysteine O-methyltransferase Ste14
MTIFSYIIVASWAVFLFYWLISSFSVKRNIGGGWWGAWRSGWWVRITIVVVVIILVHFLSPGSFGGYHIGPFSQDWTPTGNSLLAGIGSALCVLGIALAIWARAHLGRNWSSHPTLKEDHELVTSGPYALIRHPIYTGLIFAALGTGLIEWPWVIVLLGMSIMFIWRVGREEKLMTQQFPDQYPEYKKRTWALFPYIW